MINLGLMGGGFITQYYELAFKNSNNVKLTAIADLKEDCIARNIYKDVPFYVDYKEMLQKE